MHDPGRVLNIAHRGASAHAPEHTFAAYDLALEMGADYIEQDLQMTRDGVLVVLHDATLGRTARGPKGGCDGAVGERTLEELRRCDVGSWFNEAYPDRARPEFDGLSVPTLNEVFGRYGSGARYYIETKNPEEAPGMEEELVRLMADHDVLEGAAEDGRVLIQSFSPDSLRRVRALDPRLPTIQLVGRRQRGLLRRMADVRTYADGLGPDRRLVDEDLIHRAVVLGLWVHPYTVDDEDEMERLIDMGVDGMFTNHPDRLAGLLAS